MSLSRRGDSRPPPPTARLRDNDIAIISAPRASSAPPASVSGVLRCVMFAARRRGAALGFPLPCHRVGVARVSRPVQERRCAGSALRVRSRDMRVRDAGSGFRSCSGERGGGLRRWCALITKRLLILTLLSAPMASEPGTGVSSALGVVSSRAAARPAGAPPGHYVDAAVDAAAWARSQTPNRPCLAAD